MYKLVYGVYNWLRNGRNGKCRVGPKEPWEIRQQLIPMKGDTAPRISPASRDVQAALTRGPMRGEVGADICLLGNVAMLSATVLRVAI